MEIAATTAIAHFDSKVVHTEEQQTQLCGHMLCLDGESPLALRGMTDREGHYEGKNPMKTSGSH